MRDAGIRDAAMPDADPGLFGPGSVTWQLHGDPVMWVVGVRALYLQALHPRAVRGVVQNSDFRRDAWGRLLRTASFVGEITYGTAPAAERACCPDTRYPPQALRDRPGHGGAVRRRRPRTPAVGALRRDRLVSARRPPLRLPAHRRARRRLRRRAARGRPAGRSRPRRRARRHRRAGPLLRPGPPAPCRDPRGVRGGPLPRRAARAVVPGAAAARRVAGGRRRPPSRPCRRTPRSCTAARCPPRPRPTMRLRAAGRLLRAVPATLRWQLPPGHILKAVARLGPGARPSAGRPARRRSAGPSTGRQKSRYALMRCADCRPSRPYWNRGMHRGVRGRRRRWRLDITTGTRDRAADRPRAVEPTAHSYRAVTGCTS